MYDFNEDPDLDAPIEVTAYFEEWNGFYTVECCNRIGQGRTLAEAKQELLDELLGDIQAAVHVATPKRYANYDRDVMLKAVNARINEAVQK